jgi:molecular chaperone GrpE
MLPAIGKGQRMTILRFAVSTDSNNTETQPHEDTSVGEGDAGENNNGQLEATEAAETAETDPLEEARAEATRLRDQLLRTAADFDNYRKRSRREVSDAERRGREELLRELLPVFDNLERATTHAEGATDVKALAEGIALVMRQFVDTLAKIGVERVPTLGTPFDPALHEALQHVETREHPPGTVAAEVQAGYRMGDRLVRPALVFVAKAPSSSSSPDGSGSEPAG